MKDVATQSKPRLPQWPWELQRIEAQQQGSQAEDIDLGDPQQPSAKQLIRHRRRDVRQAGALRHRAEHGLKTHLSGDRADEVYCDALLLAADGCCLAARESKLLIRPVTPAVAPMMALPWGDWPRDARPA